MIGMKIGPARSVSITAIVSAIFPAPEILLDDDLVGHAQVRGRPRRSPAGLEVELVVDVDENPVPGDGQHIAQRRQGSSVTAPVPAITSRQSSARPASSREPALAGRGAVEPAIVEDDVVAVARFLDVELDHLGAELDRIARRQQRVLRKASCLASMPPPRCATTMTWSRQHWRASAARGFRPMRVSSAAAAQTDAASKACKRSRRCQITRNRLAPTGKLRPSHSHRSMTAA